MGEKNNKSNLGLKVALYIAIGLFITATAYSVHLYSGSNKIQGELESQKQAVIDSLTAMTKHYDVMIVENENENEKEELAAAKERIQGLLDSLKVAEVNVGTLMKYKNKSHSLQRQLFKMVRQNDSLRAENIMVGHTLDSTNVVLDERKKFSDSLTAKTDALKEVIKSATVLSATALKAFGIHRRNSGKEVTTDKANRVNKIRICFSVSRNKLVENGENNLYVQIINPSREVLGENKSFKGKESTFSYSLISSFNYEGDNLDICEYEEGSGIFEAGPYTVNIYNKTGLVAKRGFTFR